MSVTVDIASGELAQSGYSVLQRALDPAVLAALAADLAPSFAATPMCQGDWPSTRTKSVEHSARVLRRVKACSTMPRWICWRSRF